MSRLKVCVPQIIVLLCLATAAAQTPEPNRDPWAGFEIGSWVIIANTRSLDGKDDHQTEKAVIVKSDFGTPKPGKVATEVYAEVDGKFPKLTMTRHHIPGRVPDDSFTLVSRNEKIKIGKQEFDCTVKEYTKEFTEEEDKTKKVKIRLKYWSTPKVKVPYREIAGGPSIALLGDVVKAEYVRELGPDKERYEAEVVDFNAKLTVKGRELTCVLQSVKAEMTGTRNGNAKSKTWLSDEVPGREVKVAGTVTVDGKQGSMETTVLDFEVKKKDSK
ncbi:MAG: hypothetical protein ACRC8S_04435 [Fimbriiglobus sp.]